VNKKVFTFSLHSVILSVEEKGQMKRSKEFSALWEKAHEAGYAAGAAAATTPMVVSQHANPLDENSPVKQEWVVPDGPCGFAWVTIKPATSAFAKWVKQYRRARAGMYGGIEHSIWEFGQSYQRKVAYARAFANVLTDAGFTAYTGDRLD
jgi:hypothetical protein